MKLPSPLTGLTVVPALHFEMRGVLVLSHNVLLLLAVPLMMGAVIRPESLDTKSVLFKVPYFVILISSAINHKSLKHSENHKFIFL